MGPPLVLRSIRVLPPITATVTNPPSGLLPRPQRCYTVLLALGRQPLIASLEDGFGLVPNPHVSRPPVWLGPWRPCPRGAPVWPCRGGMQQSRTRPCSPRRRWTPSGREDQRRRRSFSVQSSSSLCFPLIQILSRVVWRYNERPAGRPPHPARRCGPLWEAYGLPFEVWLLVSRPGGRTMRPIHQFHVTACN